MTKPEGLLELVERLDRERDKHSLESGFEYLVDDEWPRLRDSIVEMFDYIGEGCICIKGLPIDPSCEPHQLLARLDNPTPKGS